MASIFHRITRPGERALTISIPVLKPTTLRLHLRTYHPSLRAPFPSRFVPHYTMSKTTKVSRINSAVPLCSSLSAALGLIQKPCLENSTIQEGFTMTMHKTGRKTTVDFQEVLEPLASVLIIFSRD